MSPDSNLSNSIVSVSKSLLCLTFILLVFISGVVLFIIVSFNVDVLLILISLKLL